MGRTVASQAGCHAFSILHPEIIIMWESTHLTEFL